MFISSGFIVRRLSNLSYRKDTETICTHLYHFYTVSIHSLQCIQCLFQLHYEIYSKGSNTKHVRYSNGPNLFGWQMVWFSNAIPYRNSPTLPKPSHSNTKLHNVQYSNWFWTWMLGIQSPTVSFLHRQDLNIKPQNIEFLWIKD